MFKPGGRHVHIDLWYNATKNPIKDLLTKAVKKAGAIIVGSNVYDFDNEGYTEILLLTESHASIHTWPEHNFIAVDFFFCGNANIDNAIETVIECFDIKKVVVNKYLRGEFTDEG